MRLFYLLTIFIVFVAGCNDDDQVTFEPSFIGTLGENDFSFTDASVGVRTGEIFGGAIDTTEVFTFFGGQFGIDDGVRISIGFSKAPGVEDFENLIGIDLITADTFPQLHHVALIIAGNIAGLSDGRYSDNLLVIDRVKKTSRPNQALVPIVESGNIIEIEGRVKFEFEVEGAPTILEGKFKAEAFEML